MLVWGKHRAKPPFRVKIRLSKSFKNEYSSRRLEKPKENLIFQQFPTNIRTLLKTLLIVQIQSLKLSRSSRIGRNQLIKGHAMRLSPKALHRVFWGRIAWMKMSRSCCWGWRLRFETPRYINGMMLHFLVPKVGDHNMGRVKGMERIGRIREMKRMERVRGVLEVIAEIK